jgi:hypothetical protein
MPNPVEAVNLFAIGLKKLPMGEDTTRDPEPCQAKKREKV